MTEYVSFNPNNPGEKATKKQVDTALKNIGIASNDNKRHKLFHGFNHSRAGYVGMEPNSESTPMVFFTRPVLNLTYPNLARERYLSPLMSTNPDSMGCAVKSILSPLNRSAGIPYDGHSSNVRSNHVDDMSPFIPLLSNLVKDVSGWPDRSIDVYSFNENIRKGVVSMADSTFKYYNKFNLNVNFKNVAGDPLYPLFTSWLSVMAGMAEGRLEPYGIFKTDNTIPYNIGIWEIILDASRTYVTKITRTIGFPLSFPDGAYFNFSKENPISPNNKDISVPFECIGAEHNDPILLKEFNDLVTMMNPFMGDHYRHKRMYHIKREDLLKHNGQGYPRIEEDMSFNWYYYNS